MKLFKKNKFAWSEPWFFSQRIRDRSDWIRAVLPALGAGVLIVVLLLFGKGANLGWWQITLCGLGLASVVQLGIEAAYIRRDISIDEEAIEAFGNAGRITSFAKHRLKEIVHLEIRRSEEIGFPFGMLVLRTPSSGNVIGIPNSIRLERLAQTLADLQVPVILSGWSPAATPEEQNPYYYAAPEGATLQPAQVDSIPEIERNLTPLPEMLVALLLGVWVFLVWLGLIGWGVYAIYDNWQAMSIWYVGCAVILGFVSMMVPFSYYEIFGDYLSATHLIRAGKKRVQLRAGSLVEATDEKLISVELILRETWAAMAPKVVDFGFIVVDNSRRRILYEGNKERWIVPSSSVKLCKIEEVQYGTGGESVTGELRCFVVLTYQRAEGLYEIGMRVADKDLGKNTDARRMRKAVELYEYLMSGVEGT